MNKPPRVHFDEVVTHSDAEQWEPVHRLDFETSGCLLLARPPLVAQTRALFGDPVKISKIYLAGTRTALPDSLTQGQPIEGFIGARYRSSKKVRFVEDERDLRSWHSTQPVLHKIKKTEWPWPESGAEAKASFGPNLYRVQLISGARHQIRAYFAAQAAPLCGDPIYGVAAPDGRMALHSWELSFENPIYPPERISAQAQPF